MSGKCSVDEKLVTVRVAIQTRAVRRICDAPAESTVNGDGIFFSTINRQAYGLGMKCYKSRCVLLLRRRARVVASLGRPAAGLCCV